MNDEVLCNALRYEKWDEAADRIEALTAKVKLMDDLDVINGEKIEALTEQLEAARADAKEAEAYAEELEKRVAFVEGERRKTLQALLKVTKIHDEVESKLAKAAEGLREIAGECGCSTARAIIAEIEGEKE